MKSLFTRYPDLPFALLLLMATTAILGPASWWVAGQAVAHQQIQQSFFVLLFAAVILWIDHRKTLSPVVTITRRSLLLLTASFCLMGAGMIFQTPYLPLLAITLALASFIHILFGENGLRLTLPWVAAFLAFLCFVLLFHFLDWPLRKLAGGQAAQILTLLGFETELETIFRPSGMLLLTVNRRLYEVAAECNGFGLMSTSVILALLLVISRPLEWPWKILAVILAFTTGFVFNLLRIIGIVTLAPFFPAHYNILHETLGITALFTGLGFLWWLLGGGKRNKDPDSKPDSTDNPPKQIGPVGVQSR